MFPRFGGDFVLGYKKVISKIMSIKQALQLAIVVLIGTVLICLPVFALQAQTISTDEPAIAKLEAHINALYDADSRLKKTIYRLEKFSQAKYAKLVN